MNTPRSSRTALRNLVIVLLVGIGFLIYAYGWTVTSIDLDKPQEPTRQQNVTSALQELLSPRIFEQDRILQPARAPFIMNCDADTPLPEAEIPTDGSAYVVITPTCGSNGDLLTVEAFNYASEAEARIRWIPQEGQTRPRSVVETGRQEITLDASGHFIGQIEVPRISNSNGQVHYIEFVSATPDGDVRFSDTTNEVLRRMAETIFMALMATSLAIPISVVISFFAAHNLMKPIRTPLGNIMVAVVAFPIGYWLGSLILGEVGQFAVNLGQGALFNTAPAFILLFGTTLATHPFKQFQPPTITDRLRSVGGQLLLALVIVFAIGLLGGLGLLIGEKLLEIGAQIRPEAVSDLMSWVINAIGDGVAGVGQMLVIIGGLIELMIISIAGIVGGVVLAMTATRLTALPMRNSSTSVSHVLGGLLGIGSGAVVMAGVSSIGTSAALFGLLPPFIAALLASQVVSLIFKRVVSDRRKDYLPSQTERIFHRLLSLVAAIAVFVFAFNWMNISRAIIDGTLPSVVGVDFLGLSMPYYVQQGMIIGAILGGIGGFLAGVRATFMIGDVLYNITRNVLNALRSIEPLIMGLIFVIWVGIGPFAGVLALTLHSIASLGKLYSEQIETIDQGPIEALQSTGANHLQTIIYAVVPQIVPPYIAFTMYRWDINVRMSTIIGFVGGGGIGLLLNQQINLLRYRDAGVAVLAIAIVVSILDYASASIRERVM